MFKKQANKSVRRPNVSHNNEKVISYYSASRKQLDTFERSRGREKPKKNKYNLEIINSKITRIILIVPVLIIFVYSSFLSYDPVIKINGSQYRTMSSYQLIAKKVISGNFRDSLKFLQQTQNDSSKLSELLPEATSIKFGSTLLGHNPVITITTEKPFMIFQQKGAPDFIIGQSGRALLTVGDALKMYQALPKLINASSINNRAGDQVLSPDEANELLQLVSQYRADNSFPSFSLPNNPYEIDVKEVGKSYFVKYSLDATILTQYGSLRATELELKQLGQTPSQYIDVRLANKVFYL